ncbi:amidohydrolase [Roseibium sp. RKSG952]|uniref:amidohydrolase n=1 Tax=Roseibium sp. RKSG952 TaxID=2529384 RepID=UPI0012BC1EA5|nr:amidohydrolase [Roseibium sp. RKSG952]MTI02751.1 amidohydrolase [Roseibium sp. RKSG952]
MGDFSENLRALRHEFHANPELGFQEEWTKSRIAKHLHDLGIEVHEGVGIVGILRAGKGNRAIGLRADFDALPITEINDFPHRSRNEGIMHACGHDGHTTMLLGAAELLVKDPDFDGTVVLLFQPNEEHGLGAKAMIDEGVLERFPIQEVYGAHNLPGEPVGHVSTRAGVITFSENLFEIEIKGQGGHASMPHVGRETITPASELVLALQTIVSRRLPPSSGAVVSVTEFITDGQRNVLPGCTVLKGDARAASPEDRRLIEDSMRQIAAGIALSHNVDVNVEFRTEFVEAVNNVDAANHVIAAAEALQLDTDGNRPSMTFSEDFANFAAAVPGCFLLIGNGTEGSHGRPLHSADYDFNDELLPIGANLWAELVRQRLPKRG